MSHDGAMEAFLSAAVTPGSVEALLATCPIGWLFSGADRSSEGGQLALDCLRRLFQDEAGMALLETEEAAGLLSQGLQSGDAAVRDTLFTMLANLAAVEAPRMRSLLVDGGSLKLVVDALADDSVSVSVAAQRLLLELTRDQDAAASAAYLSAMCGGVGGLDALAGAASGTVRVRIAALYVELATDPTVESGLDFCIAEGRMSASARILLQCGAAYC